MELEEVCKELDEARAEIKKLKAECQIKTELSNSLQKAHNEQLLRFEEAQWQIEKPVQELDAKSELFSEMRHMLKDLKSGLHEKEFSLRHFSSTKEKLCADCREKLHKLEVENREFVLALDEIIEKSKELQQKLSTSNKGSVCLVSEKKFLEAEQKVQSLKKLSEGDDVILKLENNRDIQEQLKCKAEQFQHLEEAHRRLQEQLRSREEEWEKHKSTMLEEISSLQMSLDSQTSISDSLQNQLEICNQVLAHQESVRRILENQVSEFKLSCKNEYNEEKSRMESLTAQRDKELAELRNLLVNKEAHFRELEIRVKHLDQENKELAESLRELRKSKIGNAGAASLQTELCNKLKEFKQVHSNCCTSFKAKECEWSSEMEKMKDDITSYKSELKGKEKQIQELHLELENLHSTVDVLNNEFSVLLMVIKSEFSEAYSRLLNAKAEVEQCSKQKEEKISFLTEQLKMKNEALNRSQYHVEQEHEKVMTLLKRLESLNGKDQQRILLMEEPERQKKMLQEMCECQFYLKEQVWQMENAVKSDRKEIYDTLEEAEFKLAEIIREGHRLEVEWQKRNSTVESLKVFSGQNKDMHKQIETSLLVQPETEQTLKQEKECLLSFVKDQDKSVDNLKLSREPKIAETEVVEALITDKENLLCIFDEKDNYKDTLHSAIFWLMEESIRRESEVEICASLDAAEAFQKEHDRLLKILNAKEQSIRDLFVLVMSVEKDFTHAVTSHFSEITEMQVQINAIVEALNNDVHQRKLEVEEKNMVIAGLEKEVSSLCQKLQAMIEAKKMETKKLMNQFQNEKMRMKALVEELEIDKGVLLQDIMKLSSEKENILVLIEEFYDHLTEISIEDAKLMKLLQRKIQSCEEETVSLIDMIAGDELGDSSKRNNNCSFTLPTIKPEKHANERSALKELNI